MAGGGLVVALMAVSYANSVELFLSPLFQWSLVVPYLATMVLAVAATRPRPERLTATRIAFVAFALVSACYYVYTYLLFEVFDPELYARQSELMIANAERFDAGEPGRLEDSPAVRFAPERLRYTLGGTLFAYVQSLLFGGAVAFLIGHLLGRRPAADAG